MGFSDGTHILSWLLYTCLLVGLNALHKVIGVITRMCYCTWYGIVAFLWNQDLLQSANIQMESVSLDQIESWIKLCAHLDYFLSYRNALWPQTCHQHYYDKAFNIPHWQLGVNDIRIFLVWHAWFGSCTRHCSGAMLGNLYYNFLEEFASLRCSQACSRFGTAKFGESCLFLSLQISAVRWSHVLDCTESRCKISGRSLHSISLFVWLRNRCLRVIWSKQEQLMPLVINASSPLNDSVTRNDWSQVKKYLEMGPVSSHAFMWSLFTDFT